MVLPSVQWLGILFGLSEIALAIFKRSGRRAQSQDGGSLRLLWIVILLSIGGGALASRFFPQFNLPYPSRFYTVGLIVCLLGMALRWFAIFYLGRFFTVDVAIAADHRLIDTGPYAYVRHPSYSGALLAFAGLALCYANAATFLIVTLPVTWAFYRRIHHEETALRRSLGPAYEAYASRTKRLIPGLL